MSTGSDTDPLLRAIAAGDERCPDGRALARLGALTRDDGVRPRGDLAERVLHRLRADLPADATLATAVDAYVERGAITDAALGRLGELVRGVSLPRRVDLAERVRAGLARSDARSDRTLDGSARFRMWSAVIAGHIAAVLFIAVFRGDIAHAAPPDPTAAAVAAQVPQTTATSWAALAESGSDLFRTRREPALRMRLAQAYGLDAGAAVPRMLDWIAAQQRPDGGFAGRDSDPDRALAVQSLAMLALLGEAPGERGNAVPHGLNHLADLDLSARHPTAIGLAALALTEGALLTGDDARRSDAERALARVDLDATAPGALPGFAWLALETAHHGGLAHSERQLQRARTAYGRGLPDADAEVDRIGLAAFIRCIGGARNRPATQQLAATLALRPPHLDADGAAAPLRWLFPALALREAGGPAWMTWADGLRTTLPALVDGDGRVPATRIHYADGNDLLATALTALVLQVPYRYLPLAR